MLLEVVMGWPKRYVLAVCAILTLSYGGAYLEARRSHRLVRYGDNRLIRGSPREVQTFMPWISLETIVRVGLGDR